MSTQVLDGKDGFPVYIRDCGYLSKGTYGGKVMRRPQVMSPGAYRGTSLIRNRKPP